MRFGRIGMNSSTNDSGTPNQQQVQSSSDWQTTQSEKSRLLQRLNLAELPGQGWRLETVGCRS